MQSEIKRLNELSSCMMLSKTSRDAVKWALEQIGGLEVNEKETANCVYPSEFEWLWSNYPNRSGSQGDKRKSLKVCEARVKEGLTWKELARYMKAYEQYCVANEQINTSFVMQFQKFFGNGEHYKGNWSVDNSVSKKKSATQSLIERADSGELYQDNVGGFIAVDGRKYESAIAYHSGSEPIE